MMIKGKHIEHGKNFIRGSIIPYTYYKNDIYFLLGIDRKTNEYSDFGGGIKKKESLYNGTLRELEEELCGILKHEITKQTLRDSFALVNSKNTHVIFFVNVSNKWIPIIEDLFLKQLSKPLFQSKKYKELKRIEWIPLDEFINLINDNPENSMWKNLQHFLKYNINVIKSIFQCIRINYNHVCN